MSSRRAIVASLLITQLSTAACATYMNGTTDSVQFQSIPDGADMEIRDDEDQLVAHGQTPMRVDLARGSTYMSAGEYTVHVSKAGYLPRSVLLSSRSSGWYFWNPAYALLPGAIIGGLIVDPISGGMWEFNEVETIQLEADLPLFPADAPGEPGSATRQ